MNRILIIGGGASGMAAAISAAQAILLPKSPFWTVWITLARKFLPPATADAI